MSRSALIKDFLKNNETLIEQYRDCFPDEMLTRTASQAIYDSWKLSATHARRVRKQEIEHEAYKIQLAEMNRLAKNREESSQQKPLSQANRPPRTTTPAPPGSPVSSHSIISAPASTISEAPEAKAPVASPDRPTEVKITTQQKVKTEAQKAKNAEQRKIYREANKDKVSAQDKACKERAKLALKERLAQAYKDALEVKAERLQTI